MYSKFLSIILFLYQFSVLAQSGPGTTPEVFAPGIVSKSFRHEFGSIISKNGDEVYFGVDTGGRNEILYSRLINGEWSEPQVIIMHEVYGYNDPMLSNDEKRLYYISDQPISGTGERKDIDIWYSEKTEDGWSSPINAGSNINTSKNEYYISFSSSDAMYFASNKATGENDYYNFDIYKSEFINGKFQEPVRLSDAINTHRYEADVYVAPDESYLIFCAIRNDGLGQGDLYISFKDKNGNWTPGQNMGEPINSPDHELCPFVTPDGEYFLYTSNKDIYWVSTEIFKKYRK